MKLIVTTKYNDYVIHSEITQSCEHWDLDMTLTKHALKLQDEQVRNALIELGWTPPKENDGQD